MANKAEKNLARVIGDFTSDMMKTHFEADISPAGGGYSLCGHSHRSIEAAEKCLPKVPRNRSGSLTQNFSMARVWEVRGDGLKWEATVAEETY